MTIDLKYLKNTIGLAEDNWIILQTTWWLMRSHWCLLLIVFGTNLLVACFQGSTMAIFALAIQAIMGETTARFGDVYGVFGRLADSLFGSLDREQMFLALIGLAVASVLLRVIFHFFNISVAASLTVRISKEVWGRIFNQFMTISYAQISKYKIGDLQQYLGDAKSLDNWITRINKILGDSLVLLVYSAMLLWLSWHMTLFSLIYLIFISLLLTVLVRKIRTIAESYLPNRIEMGVRYLEFLRGMRLVRIFAREEYASQKMDQIVDSVFRQQRKRQIYNSIIKPLMQLITTVSVAGLLIFSYASLNISWPRLLTFLFLLYRVIPVVGNLNQGRTALHNLFPQIRRVNLMLRTDDKEYTRSGDRKFERLEKGIECDHVFFNYKETNDYALRNVSMRIPRGKMIAIVGESGAGKSTATDLLLRLYDPGFGRIMVDDVDIKEFDVKSWRNRIGYVSQDTFIFNSSIRDNIAFGKLNASDEEIMAAAKAANAHGFITELEDGYATVVGDRGYRLSGGQRQRIAIAQAVLRNPEILILDEATSDLDSIAESEIQKTLANLRKNRTVICIAHRLSTISKADIIYVLKKGRIEEEGTHGKLLDMNGYYAQFWSIQAGVKKVDEMLADSTGGGNFEFER